MKLLGGWILGMLVMLPAFGELPLIPRPTTVTTMPGTLVLHGGEGIDAPADARAQWIATFLRKHVEAQTGVALKVGSKLAHPAIELRIDPTITGQGAYHLEVSASGATISAADNRGLFWGVQTLRQLLPLSRSATATLPAVRIADAPRYPWRGVMLDVGRHFYPVSFVKRQIALMSYYKFNVFHWHLTEDQGWRLQSNQYPKLTSVGAWREGPNGKREGGFYTQAQIRAVVQYARERNVMIVPEIEMPGHISAAIAAYPALSCSGTQIDVPTTWGVLRNAVCPDQEYTFKFLENVLDEVTKLFPSPYVDIGGDEVPMGVWDDCKGCAALASKHGFKNDEAGLHGYFVRRIQKYLQAKGKTLVGFDEILEGGIDSNPIVDVWHLPSGVYGGSDEFLKSALANGNRVLLAGPFYLDFPIDEMTLKDLYTADPFDDPLFAKYPGKLLGGEAPLWSEHATPLNGFARYYPRLLAISEHFWNPAARDWAGFQARAHAQEAWLASQHVPYGPDDKNIVSYTVRFVPQFKRWRIGAVRGFADMRLHYTLDGSRPTAHSPAFTDLLDLYRPATVTVAPFVGAVQYQAAETFKLVSSLALGDEVKVAGRPVRGNPSQLTDGITGGADLGRNDVQYADPWLVWPAAGMDATVDLGSVETIHRVATDFLQFAGERAVFPQTVKFEVSTDGQAWTTVGSATIGADPRALWLARVRTVDHAFATPVQARYVRVVAGYDSSDYRPSGVDAHVVSDEVVVQ